MKDILTLAFLSACLFPDVSSGGAIASATATGSENSVQTCFQTQTKTDGSAASATCSNISALAGGSGSASFLDLSFNAMAGGGNLGVGNASITVNVSYDDWVIITGGTGPGLVSVTYDETGTTGSLANITQGQFVSVCSTPVKGECVTSSFTYGVPFEMTASFSAFLEAHNGDDDFTSEGSLLLYSALDQNGDPVTLQVVAGPGLVPEPGTIWFGALGVMLVAFRRYKKTFREMLTTQGS